MAILTNSLFRSTLFFLTLCATSWTSPVFSNDDTPDLAPNEELQRPSLEKRYPELMEKARHAFATGDFNQAIKLYTKILNLGASADAPTALEFLGVSRERKQQFAQAKAVYQQYLSKYPESEHSSRVQQRLTGILTMASPPSEKLKAAKNRRRNKPEWQVYGGLSSYYRYADISIENVDNRNNLQLNQVNENEFALQSSVSTDLSVSARKRSANWNIRTRFSGGYVKDLLNTERGDYQRLSNFYVDAEHNASQWRVSAGRQSSSTGGVLGRFDGIDISKGFGDNWSLNVVAGAPVDRSTLVSVNSDRFFYGVNVDLTMLDNWEFNVFALEQTINGLLDRRSIGAEARYFSGNKSLFSLVDYDIEYGSLNTLLLIGSWTSDTSTTYSFTADVRNSPILTTRNAIQGQLVDGFEELLSQFTEDELRALAEDRTAKSKLFTLSINKPLSDHWRLYASASMNSLSSMPESAGVIALEGTGSEYSYDLQFIASSLLFDNDNHIFGLRYYDGSLSSRTSLRADGRYPIGDKWRINPRLRVDYRQDTNSAGDQWFYRPSIRVDYRHKRKHFIEIEVGQEWTDRQFGNDLGEKTTGLFALLGYRYNF